MADSLALIFRIQADSAGASDAINAVSDALRDIGTTSVEVAKTSTDSLQDIIASLRDVAESTAQMGADTGEALAGVRDSLGEITPAADDSKDSTDKASESLTHLGGSASAVSETISSKLNVSLTNLASQGGATTSVIAELGAALGGLATPLGIVTIAAAATGGAVVALGLNFAEAGSRIHDLALQTGLSAEALSGLEVAAKLGGGSLEQLTSAFVRFQRQAVDGSDEVKEAFAAFGITTEQAAADSEKAFDVFLKGFNEMGAGAERTALLIRLFGRSGAQLIPVLEEAGIGLDELKAKARELGISFSPDAANAADALGDTVDELKLSMQGLLLQAAAPLVPQLQQILYYVKQLQPAFNALSFVVASMSATTSAFNDVIGLTISLVQTLAGSVTQFKLPDIPTLDLKGKFGSDNLEILQNLIRTGNKEGKVFPQKPRGGGAAAAVKKDISELEAELRQLKRLADDSATLREEDQARAKRFLQENPQELAEFYKRALKAEQDYLTTMESLYDKEVKLLDKQKLLPRERADAEAEILQQRGKTIQEANKRIAEILDEQDVKNEQTIRSQIAVADASRQLMIAHTEQAAQAIANLEKERQALLALQFTAEEIERAAVDAQDRRLAGMKKFDDDQKALRKKQQQEQLADPHSMASIFGIEDPKGDASIIEGVAGAMKGGLEDLAGSFGNFRDFAGQAMAQVAAAAQSMLSAFILTGKAGGAAFKKLTADILAALVVQSAVKAIFELAEGFAALWLNPSAAAAHFKAAALYGVVAGTAGAVAAGIGASGGLGGGVDSGGFGGGQVPQGQTPQDTRFTGIGLGVVGGFFFDKLNTSIEGLNEQVGNLNNKISSMSPGDVVTVGAPSAGNAIATSTIEELKRNAETTNNLGRLVFGPV